MRVLLLIVLLVFGCVACRDSRAKTKQFDKKYTDLGEVYLNGDIHAADRALAEMERLVSEDGKSIYTADGLPFELGLLRARRAQIAERLGDHARAQLLMGEAMTFLRQAGKNTNGGPAEVLKTVEWLEEKKTVKWKQTTN